MSTKCISAMKIVLIAILTTLLSISYGAAYNKSWDQGHKCINPSGGESGWGRYDYNGKFKGNYGSKECCEILCKICPIYANTGQYQKTYTDLSVPGIGPALHIVRTYNSQDWTTSLLGKGWVFNLGKRLIITRNKDGQKIIGVLLETGEKNYYKEDIDGILTRLTDYGTAYDLIKNADNTYTIVNRDDSRYELREDGKIAKIIDQNHNELVFSYNSVGCLSRITNASGNYVDFQLGPNGKIASVSDNLGRTVVYTYDENGNLTSVTDPLGNTRQYVYNSENLLAQIIDARGNIVESATYDNNQPPRVSTFIEKGETYTIAYFDGRTEKTDSQGNKWTYYFNDLGIIERVVDPLGHETNRKHNKVTSTSVDWEEDANGNRTTYTYDADGNIASTTDPLGNTWNYTYVAGTDRLETETDPLGVVTRYEYDENGNLTGLIRDCTGSLENVTTYSYDANGNLIGETDPLGNTTHYQHNDDGKMTRITDSLGNVTAYTYDDLGNRITETDALGNTTTYEYDFLGRRTKLTNSLGNSVSYEYDAVGNLTAITDFNGNRYSFEYDAYGRRNKTTNAAGISWSSTYLNNYLENWTDECGSMTYYHYDLEGRIIMAIQKVGDTSNTADADDLVWQYSYDSEGNLLSETDPLGGTSTYTYDGDNRKVSETNPEGETTYYTYDALGNVTSKTYVTGITTEFTYDTLGRMIEQSDSLGVIMTLTHDGASRTKMIANSKGETKIFEYDAVGNVIKETDAMGRDTTYIYDGVSNLLSMTDRQGHTTYFEYDADGQLVKVVDALGNSKEYSYDQNGNQIAIKDPLGHATFYQFDQLNRLIKRTHADGSSEQFSYDCFGNLETYTNQKGEITHYVYDDLYRRTQIDYPGTSDDASFTYDKLNRILTAKNEDSLLSFEYDRIGRVTKSVQNGHVIQYAYDIANGTRTLRYPSGSTVVENYDQRGRLTAINDSYGSEIASYSFDSENHLVLKSISNRLISNYSYNPNGWCTNTTYQVNGEEIYNYDYVYSDEGHRLYKKSNHNLTSSETYSYDAKYRLVGFNRGRMDAQGIISDPDVDLSYSYDGVGNRATMANNGEVLSYVSNPTNGYQSLDGTFWAYDENGNLIDDSEYTYSYNPSNKLIKITEKSLGSAVVSYDYDALGRRWRKTEPTSTTEYVFDGATSTIIAEINGQGSASEIVHGLAPMAIVILRTDGSEYCYLTDISGSVLAVTDKEGNLLEQYSYNPFGELSINDAEGTSLSKSSIGNSFYYIGQTYQVHSSLYEFEARVYDPEHGRFLTFDPMGFIDGLNLYQYASNNPISYFDPSGLIKATASVTSPISYNYSGGFGLFDHTKTKVNSITMALKEAYTGRDCCRDGTIVKKGEAKEKKYEIDTITLSVQVPIYLNKKIYEPDKNGAVWWIQCHKPARLSSGYFPKQRAKTKPSGPGWRLKTLAGGKTHELTHRTQSEGWIRNYFSKLTSPNRTWCPPNTVQANKERSEWQKQLEKKYGADSFISTAIISEYSANPSIWEAEADDAQCGF